jgi:hypothetical protein
MFIIGAALMAAGRLGQTRPGPAIVAIIALFALPALWRLGVAIVRDFFLSFFIGFGAGEGVKASGVLKQLRPRQHAPRQPRTRHRREGQYFPWNDSLDGVGDDSSYCGGKKKMKPGEIRGKSAKPSIWRERAQRRPRRSHRFLQPLAQLK